VRRQINAELFEQPVHRPRLSTLALAQTFIIDDRDAKEVETRGINLQIA
jgi:hypothetical protein